MPVDIRPPPGVALSHYPNAFNPWMAFQVRERDTATLEEMQNIVVDVEMNLRNREAKFKTEEELIQFDSPPLCLNSYNKMQTCFDLFEDMENICAIPCYEVGSIGSEYSEIGQVYFDPVAIYIEKLFITRPSYLSNIFVVVQVYQAPCKEYQVENSYQIPLAGLFLSLLKNSERARLLEQLLAWLHYNYCIIYNSSNYNRLG